MYRTIVVDPPWDHSDGTGYSWGPERYAPSAESVARNPRYATAKSHVSSAPKALAYPVMGLSEIHALPVPVLAEKDAHLYLWTTQRFLRDSFDVAEAWGFSVSATLTWCKAPKGFMGGAFRSSTEFCHFCRRGNLPHRAQAPSRWFQWPRTKVHSQKPEAFMDLVEQVSPGPYLELFARRQRLGWDTWGNEALNHVGRHGG